MQIVLILKAVHTKIMLHFICCQYTHLSESLAYICLNSNESRLYIKDRFYLIGHEYTYLTYAIMRHNSQIYRSSERRIRKCQEGTVNVSWRGLHYSALSSFMEMCHTLRDLKEAVGEVCETYRSCDLLIKGALHWFGLAPNEIFRACHICQIEALMLQQGSC